MINKKRVKAFLMAALCMAAISGCGKGTGEKEPVYVDLAQYYGVSEEGQYGIVVDGAVVGTGITVNEKIYIPQDVVASEINSQFYYDKENNQIRYATPTDIKTVDINGAGGEAIKKDDKVYLDLEYVVSGSKVKQIMAEDPDRIVFFKQTEEIGAYKTKESTRIYSKADTSSAIMKDLDSDTLLYQLDDTLPYGNVVQVNEVGVIEKVAEPEEEDWLELVTIDGIKGFVKADAVESRQKVSFEINVSQPEYIHISLGKKVCLGWQLMTNTAANSQIDEKISGASALNVISPTWYAVNDEEGNITSYASKDYVRTAHSKGIQVWALINDFVKDENGESFIRAALESTSSRKNIIDKLVSEAKEYDFDGINIDFEQIDEEHAADYVQFMRELSVECRLEEIILSVDVGVPMSFNQQYGRKDIGEVVDYLIIMGYDEHWGGGSQAGSVASLAFVQNGIYNTLKVADADRVINAIPFYTRIWAEIPEDISDGTGVYVEDSINGNYYLTSRAVGMDTAESSVRNAGKEPIWLESVGQYYAEYEKDGVLYRVWLEDERSLGLKLECMDEEGLAGVACWQLGYEKAAIWDLLGEYVN